MAHQRVRKFNTKDTYPEQKLDNDLCRQQVKEDHGWEPDRLRQSQKSSQCHWFAVLLAIEKLRVG